MTAYLVTVETGGAFDFGPSVVVEAETIDQAAEDGVEKLSEEDSTYGVDCQHCDHVQVEIVLVFELSTGVEFKQDTVWVRAT